MSEQLDLFIERQRYRYWDVLDEMPDGWVIDNTAGSPAPRTVFITNGKSPISGQQKRALLRIKSKSNLEADKTDYISKLQNTEEDDYSFPAKSVNDLARTKFKYQILKEIMFDLMVCKIEGWDKKEYINELKELINEIKTD